MPRNERCKPLPAATPAELLHEAVILARGSHYILAAQELAEPSHAFALLELQAKIEEGDL